MERALLVSSTDKGKDLLVQLIKDEYPAANVATAQNGNEVRRLLLDNEYDLIIINTPLTDEFGHELAIYTTQSSDSGVMLIVKNEAEADVSARVEEHGIFVVAKPIVRPLFYQALKFIITTRKRLLGISRENVKLQNKMNEMRMVDRAKCTLIQYLNMTEAQAHRYIEKQAMDMRVSKREIAENILKTYENNQGGNEYELQKRS